MEKMEATFLLIFIALTMQTCCLAATSSSSSSSSSSASTTKMYVQFIKTQCNVTTYRSLCNKVLSPQASKVKTNPQTLCYAAMSVALQSARNASATVVKLLKKKGLSSGDKAVVKDCIDELGDSIDELKSSLDAIGNIRNVKGNNEVEYQMDNIKTWVSAAITDEGTCTDELDEENVNSSVKKKIVKAVKIVAQLTSNVLCLINHYNY